MSEYAKVFAENRIDLSVLPDLTDQHLEKLGVALGDRLKILRAIRELSATAVAARPGLSAVPVVPGARVGSDRRRRRGHLSRALRRLDVRDLPSKPVAKEIIARAQGGPDQEACLVGHITGGFTDLMAGELAPARGHYVEAVDLYETRSAEASLVDRYPIDLGAIAYAYSAWCRWLLGQPDKAVQFIRPMHAVVDRSQHRFTTLRALYWTAVLHQFRGEWAIVRAQSDRLIALAEDLSYAMGMAVGRILRGAALTIIESDEVGMREMRTGLAAYLATGTRVEEPYYLTLLAEVMRTRGLVEEGLAILDEARDRVQETGERYFEAEIHRTRGALLLARRDAHIMEATASYQRAIEIARMQGARSLELRASAGLARPWRDQGKCAEARDLLAPIYGWFTEGFDTPILQDAKALLDELA